jgi:predicted DNA-binding transcriptional regulator AlpA
MLSKREFARKIGKSERHVERLIERGEGPPTVKTGDRAVGITEQDADAWIKERRKIPPGWNDSLVNFLIPIVTKQPPLASIPRSPAMNSTAPKLAGGSRCPPRKSRRRRTVTSQARTPKP